MHGTNHVSNLDMELTSGVHKSQVTGYPGTCIL